MPDRFRSYFKQLLDRWNGLERKFRIQIVAITAILVVALGVTIYLTSRPTMVDIYAGLDIPTLNTINTALASASPPINSSVNVAGKSIRLREQDVDAAIVIAESQGLVSDYSITYQDLINFSSMTASSSTMSVLERKALETELENMIQSNIKGVRSASVMLTLPQVTSYFMDASESKKATAGVTLIVDGTFDRAIGEALARIISRAVPNLSIEDVDIIDQNGGTIYSSSSYSSGGGYRDQMDAKHSEEERMMKRVNAVLAPFSSSVQTMVNLAFDWRKIDSSSRTLTNPTGEESSSGFIDKEYIDKSQYSNISPENAPGTDPNNNQTPTYDTSSGDNSSAKTDHQERSFLYNEEIQTITGISGTVLPEKSSLSSILYIEKVIPQDYAEKNNIMGNLNWEQFKAANDRKVEAITDFDAGDGILASLKVGTGIDNIVISAYTVTICEDRIVKPLAVEQIVIFSILVVLILLLAVFLLRIAKPDEEVVIEPELSVEDLLVSTKLDEVKKAEAERLAGIEFNVDSEIKKHIDKFVTDRPEAVAQLLRNWLNEDWD